MRPIDADALKREITESGEDCTIANYVRNVLRETLDNVPTIDAVPVVRCGMADWISVKDRFPERQEPVIVYVPPYSDEDEEYVGHVAVAYYTQTGSGGYWAGTDGNVYGAIGIIHEPTHWMPLPEPPKEEYGDER